MKVQVHLTRDEADQLRGLFDQGKLESFKVLDVGSFEPIRASKVELFEEDRSSDDASFDDEPLDSSGDIVRDQSRQIPLLIDVIRSDDRFSARQRAITALGRIGKPAIPHLIELMEHDQNARIRKSIAMTLGGIGDDAIPDLVSALWKSNEILEPLIARALKEIGSAAIPILRQALWDNPSFLRAKAAKALAIMGAIPTLLEAMSSGNPDMHLPAAAAIWDSYLFKDPWKYDIGTRYKRGDKVKGRIRKSTEFWVYVELEKGLDGLLHVSEVSDTAAINAKRNEVDVTVLWLDTLRGQIYLSRKELQSDDEREAK